VSKKETKLGVRLDLKVVNGKPVLVGLAVESFGWIVGGNHCGSVVIDATLDLDTPSGNPNWQRGDPGKIKKLIRDFDYHENGGNFRVECPR
jgi:hypothetical protein